MGGTSQKETGTNNLQNLLTKFYTDTQKDQGFQSKNLFEDYKSPFDYGKTSAELDKLNNQEIANVNKNAISDINKVSQGTASSLASQGITGGSVLNDAVNKGRTGVLQNKYQTLSDISKNRTGQNINLMQQENQNQFQNTAANQNQLNQQVMDMFRKYGLLQGNLGQQQANVGNMNDSTFWDDIFAGMNTLGQFIPGVGSILGGGSAGMAG